MRKIIVWLFHALVLITPFAFSPLNDELFEFNKMIVVYTFAVLIGAAWAARMVQKRRWIGRATFLFWPIVFYVASHVLSTLFSMHPHTSIFGYYSRFHGGLLSTLSYVLLYFAAVSNWHPRDVIPLIRTTLLAAVGVALYAIPEHFGVSPSCVLITGEFTVHCWVQDVQTRVFATFGQPNWLAAYLLMMIPLAIWYGVHTWQQLGWFSKKDDPMPLTPFSLVSLWPWIAVILFVIALTYTRSRSGYLGLALEVASFVGLAVFTLAWRSWRADPVIQVTQEVRRLFVATGLLVLMTGSLALLLGTPFSPSGMQWWQQRLTTAQVSEEAATVDSTRDPQTEPTAEETTASTTAGGTVLENGGTDSGTIRRIVWTGALRVWQRYPVFGSGLSTFAYSYYQDRPNEHNMVSEWDFLYNKAHNEFVDILATTGTVGFVATIVLMGVFVLSLLKSLIEAGKAPRLNESFVTFLIALIAGYLGLAVSNFFGFSTVMVGLLFFLYKAFWVVRHPSFVPEEATDTTNRSQPTAPPSSHSSDAAAATTQASRYLSVKKQRTPASRSSRSSDQSLDFDLDADSRWFGYAAVAMIAVLLLLRIVGMWNNDALLAQVKANLSQGAGATAYQLSNQLVKQAPLEPTYWDQHSVTLSRLAAGTASQDATMAAQLAQDAVTASDRAIQLNPVHLNFWKNRARVFLHLSTIDPAFQENALQALLKGLELAPTDVKLAYNIGLVTEALNRPDEAREAYQAALTAKPNYEEARNAYAAFLLKQGDVVGAYTQYRFVLDNLNPTAPTALQAIEALEATLSAELRAAEATPAANTETPPAE